MGDRSSGSASGTRLEHAVTASSTVSATSRVRDRGLSGAGQRTDFEEQDQFFAPGPPGGRRSQAVLARRASTHDGGLLLPEDRRSATATGAGTGPGESAAAAA